jgi:hypothetical protein
MATERKPSFTGEPEQAIVAWACRPQAEQIAKLEITHILVRLMGKLQNGKTAVVETKLRRRLCLP